MTVDDVLNFIDTSKDNLMEKVQNDMRAIDAKWARVEEELELEPNDSNVGILKEAVKYQIIVNVKNVDDTFQKIAVRYNLDVDNVRTSITRVSRAVKAKFTGTSLLVHTCREPIAERYFGKDVTTLQDLEKFFLAIVSEVVHMMK